MIRVPYFERRKRLLTAFLDGFLAGKAAEVAGIRPWGLDVVGRLAAFATAGKMLRGGLVSLGWEAAGRRPGSDVLRAGAAMELVQSALLIHDDIMDDDGWRRGGLSFHRQYARLAERRRLAGPARFGEGMGICAGEIALFLAFEALAGLSVPPRRASAALDLVTREFTLVGLGQMQDLDAGASRRPPSEARILGLYRLKTARYSFSLPLVLGCGLAGGPASLRRRLDGCGEALGMIFQLVDDDLGLFGTEAELGKPVGSDLRQGKQTLLNVLTARRAGPADRRRWMAAFGNPAAGAAEVAFARGLAEATGARTEVRSRIERYRRLAAGRIRALPVAPRIRRVLEGLLDSGLTRRK